MTKSARVIPLPDRRQERGGTRPAAVPGSRLEIGSAGAVVRDDTGLAYLDCGGHGGFLLGHRHPRVAAAVVDQINRRPMASGVLLDPTVARAAATLAEVAPPGLDFVHFVNSGTEAVEAAIKLARAHGAYRLVAAYGGSHGSTLGALSLSTRDRNAELFRPLLPAVRQVPYGDVEALGVALADGRQHCVVLEPVQADNGVVLPPAGYLSAAADLCRRHGAFLVLDETQTGLGRLGSWWGADTERVVPDALCAGSTLSGGVVPVAALLATARSYAPLVHDSFGRPEAFAGSPVAMAAVHATVHAIRDEGLVDRAGVLGARLLHDLRRILAETCPNLVREVRGAGLLIGIEFTDQPLAAAFALELLDRRVLAAQAALAPHVIRLTPPAVLADAELDWLLAAATEAARAVVARAAEGVI